MQTDEQRVEQLRLLRDDAIAFGCSYRYEGEGEVWRIDPRSIHVQGMSPGMSPAMEWAISRMIAE